MRKLVAGLVCAVALLPACAGPAIAAVEDRLPPEVSQDVELSNLHKDIEEHDTIINFMLFPVTVLVGILALGGAIGIVFSIRDQRRVSQLHELSVAGEMSSQRRTEQSYGSFFEQSQTTLSLVNETLQLAREATAQAAESMDKKAQLRVDAIEEKAQKLMLELFDTHEFDVVVFNSGRRRELQEIAGELSKLEGYLSLQNITLGPNTKFVKAIDHFIEGETELALSELQLAAQDPVVGALQKFIEYWVGYILTTVGQYGEAIERFKHDELDLPETSSQYFQLERIIIETEFFLIAKPRPRGEGDEKSELADSRSPKARFEAVAPLLDRLATLSRKLDESETRDEEAHTRLEVARTQADIYEWVAYDPAHLDDPIAKPTVDKAKQIIASFEQKPPESSPPEGEDAASSNEEPKESQDFIDSPRWVALDSEDLFRCWALLEAQSICSAWEKSSADVAFALAECHFKLGHHEAAEEFRNADHDLHEAMAEHRELRHEASHLQCLLICHCRLLKLQELEKEDEEGKDGEDEVVAADGQKEGNGKGSRQDEIRAIGANQREILDVLKKMGRGRVTIFSQIQRRNLTQDEFRAEVGKIVKDMRLPSDGKTTPGDEEVTDAAEGS